MSILKRLLRRDKRFNESPPAFGGVLFQCKHCGSLALGTWGGLYIFHSLPKGRCRRDCDFIPVSEERALSSSGMSEKKLLEELYIILNRPELIKNSDGSMPLLEELERRLGLSKPVKEKLPVFEKQYTLDIDEAVVLLRDRALLSVPILTKYRVEAEYRSLKNAWECRGLKEGTLQDIANILRKNLERDAGLPRFRDFLVDVLLNQDCAQVYSNFEKKPGARYATASFYRIWRTESAVFFCGGEDAIL